MLNKIREKNLEIKRELNNIEIKLIEEMAELTQAIMKNHQDNIREELVDVVIMLEQYKPVVFEDDEKYKKLKKYKIERTANRLKIKQEF